jgi:hypothetical protein
MRKDASIKVKDASQSCAKDAKTAQGKLRDAEEKTHDWALDLEPLALPPDLPPVILRVGGSVWLGG